MTLFAEMTDEGWDAWIFPGDYRAFGGASLHLDFTVPHLDPRITFSRASAATRTNAKGQIETVDADQPRFEYSPLTKQLLGLLVEEQRTNLLLNSVLAGGTSGTIGAEAVFPTGWGGVPSPGGQITFVTTSLGTAGIRFQATAQRPAIGRTLSVLANTVYAWHARITALTGTLTVENAIWVVALPADAKLTYWRNGAIVAGSMPVSAGDHIAAVVTVAATAGTINPRFGPGVASPATCDCTMTMPQVEAGLPSSYIPTTTAQVTRAADVCSVNTLSPWYNAAEGTIVVKAISSPSQPAPISEAYAALRGASINDRIEIAKATAQTNITGAVVVGGVAQANMNGVTLPPNTGFSAALSYKANDFAFSLNGGAVATDNSGSVPVVTLLQIGSRSSANQCNGIISDVLYYPRVTDAQQAGA